MTQLSAGYDQQDRIGLKSLVWVVMNCVSFTHLDSIQNNRKFFACINYIDVKPKENSVWISYTLRYQPLLRVEYKVQCGVGELVFFNITTLSTRGEEDCQDSAGNDRCLVYVAKQPFLETIGFA